MSRTKQPNKKTALGLDQKAIAAVGKYFANVTKVTLLGTDYTAPTLMGAFQAEVDAVNALDAGQAQMKQQVATTLGVRVKTRALRAALRKFILGAYGATAVQMLEDFGMSLPKNTGPKTAEAKAKAAAKAKATREARKAALLAVKNGHAAQAVASVSTTPAK